MQQRFFDQVPLLDAVGLGLALNQLLGARRDEGGDLGFGHGAPRSTEK
jgi:hypothetical protein